MILSGVNNMTSVMSREMKIRKLAVATTNQQRVVDAELKTWMQSRKTIKLSELKAQAKYILMQNSGKLGSYESDAIMASTSVDIPDGYGVVFRGSYVQNSLDDDISNAIQGVISSQSMVEAGTGAHAVLARRISGKIATILATMVNDTVSSTTSYYEKGGQREFYHDNQKILKDVSPKDGSHWKRVVNPGACEWCSDPARNAFERHSGCKCGHIKVGGK